MTKMTINSKTNLKTIARLQAELKEAEGMHAIVGVYGEEAYKTNPESGETNLSVAEGHEYGILSKNMPARPVLSTTFDVSKYKYQEGVETIVKREFNKPNFFYKVYEKMGILATNLIDDTFKNEGYGRWIPLAKSTIEAKKKAGKEKMLQWSGQYRRSWKSKVIKK